METEPREVMEFGNVYTPLIDLITTRYEEQLYTIFTTNLTPAQLEEKYGKRIVDRLNEMVEKVVSRMNPIEGDVFLVPWLGHNYITIESRIVIFTIYEFIIKRKCFGFFSLYFIIFYNFVNKWM